MRFYEYEAKALFVRHGTPLLLCRVALTRAAAPGGGHKMHPRPIFSDMGGSDIEEVAEQPPEHVGQAHVSTLLPFTAYKAKEAIAAVGLSGEDLNRLTPIVATLVEIFLRYD